MTAVRDLVGGAFVVASFLGAVLPEKSPTGRACRRWAADLRGMVRRDVHADESSDGKPQA